MSLKVTSEIGKLKSVLVHLPGPEIDRMVPSMMEELLFDDILYGNRAREEHRRFQQVLGFVADEVLEVQDLLEEVLQVPEQRGAVVDDLAKTLGWGPEMEVRLRDLTAEAARRRPRDRDREAGRRRSERGLRALRVPPIPNYFFQRDPLVVVGERAIRGSMATSARLREPLLSGYVLSLHRASPTPRAASSGSRNSRPTTGKPASYARMRSRRSRAATCSCCARTFSRSATAERTEKTTIERLAESFKKLKSPISGSSSSRSRRRAPTCTSTRSSR